MGDDTPVAKPADKPAAPAEPSPTRSKKEPVRQGNWQAYSPARELADKKRSEHPEVPEFVNPALAETALADSPSRTSNRMWMGANGCVSVAHAPQMTSEFVAPTVEATAKRRQHRKDVAAAAAAMLEELDGRAAKGRQPPPDAEAAAPAKTDEPAPAAEPAGATPAGNDASSKPPAAEAAKAKEDAKPAADAGKPDQAPAGGAKP